MLWSFGFQFGGDRDRFFMVGVLIVGGMGPRNKTIGRREKYDTGEAKCEPKRYSRIMQKSRGHGRGGGGQASRRRGIICERRDTEEGGGGWENGGLGWREVWAQEDQLLG